MKIFQVSAAVLFLFVAGFLFIFPEKTQAQNDAPSEVLTETVNCFDYYHFGSVQATLFSEIETVSAGTPLNITGEVHNQNTYAVADGSLYVKIFRKQKDDEGTKKNGPEVVDAFFVKKEMFIGAGKKIPLSFTWDVPAYAPSGDYQVASFFVSGEQMNLLGLSFTDDVVGNFFNFSVINDGISEYSFFDKNSITVNESVYNFASPPPRHLATEPIEVTVDIINTSAKTASVSVRWTLYSWDALRAENKIEEKTTVISVPAKGKSRVSFTVDDVSKPVYYVVGEAYYNEQKSIIGVRVVREGIEDARINSLGVVKYPIKKGVENTLFACFHGSGVSDILTEVGTVEMIVQNAEGTKIHSRTYQGKVTGAVAGIASKFKSSESTGDFTLIANLRLGDRLVDTMIIPFSCDSTTEDCTIVEENGLSGLLNIKTGIALLGAILLFVGAVFIVRMRKKSEPVAPTL